MRNTILFTLLLILVGCSSKGIVGPVALDQEFSLHIRQTAVVRGALTVRLDSIPEDSRCPLGVMCIQAGNGVVALTVTPEGGGPSRVRLNTNLPAPRDTIIAGYRITLVELKPHPVMEKAIRPEEYEAVLKVSR